MSMDVTNAAAATRPRLSIVVPALNEADNLRALAEQIDAAVIREGVLAELIVVDDGSSDDTPAVLAALMRRYVWVRGLRHDRPLGQSRAMYDGIQAARGQYVATLDADLQNDPADLPRMLQLVETGQADMVQGDRSANRRDNAVRRCTSWIGRSARRALLGDAVRDTGCSARVVKSEFAKRLPLTFRGMHRFMPVYARMLGARVIEMPVNHRPRMAGTTKYGLGVFSRAWPGLVDCLAMRWMLKRYRSGSVMTLNGEDLR
jgi:dolichol-phosphate mannosyltransferase